MKNELAILLIGVLSLTLVHCSNSQNKTTTPMPTKTTVVFEQRFIEQFAMYTMDIAAAGIARLPHATLSPKGELVISYQYTSGNEKRTGRMELTQKKKHYFEGNWKTEADNGNHYAGTLYFLFQENGTASGQYQFGGSSYEITIDKQ